MHYVILLLSILIVTLNAATTDKDFTLQNGKALILNNLTNSHFVKIKSADNLQENIILTMPSTLPQENQILIVNANGELSWADKSQNSGDKSKFKR